MLLFLLKNTPMKKHQFELTPILNGPFQWGRTTGQWSESYRLLKLIKPYSSAKSNLSRNPKADTMAIRLSIFGLLRLESTR